MKRYNGKGVADALRLAAEAGANGETILEKTVMVNGGFVIFSTDGEAEVTPEEPTKEDAEENETESVPEEDGVPSVEEESSTEEPEKSIDPKHQHVIYSSTKGEIASYIKEQFNVELDKSLNKESLQEAAMKVVNGENK